MVTVSGLYNGTVSLLREHGIDNAKFEAGCLIEKAIGLTQLDVLTEPDRELDPEDGDYFHKAAELRELVRRRVSGEPLQYILGEWEFYAYKFKVGKGVLIPRQDTETLVDTAREHIGSGMLCADLCAGSGCIGITLAKLCDCMVDCYELSDEALGYLNENIVLNQAADKVAAIKADVLSEMTLSSAPEYDVIVTNPPYLTTKDMSELQKEVTFEPSMALFGGEDGLDYYRSILKSWTKRLKKGGFIAAEIGMGQEADVMRIFEENGITAAAEKDLCGIYRVVYGIKKI